MPDQTLLYLTKDGRTLAYSEYGDPIGHPVFYAHGGPGSRIEGQMYDKKAAEYGFRLKDIPGKVHVFHGTEDTFVPLKYADHLAENIPDCELHWLEGQGHLFP